MLYALLEQHDNMLLSVLLLDKHEQTLKESSMTITSRPERCQDPTTLQSTAAAQAVIVRMVGERRGIGDTAEHST